MALNLTQAAKPSGPTREPNADAVEAVQASWDQQTGFEVAVSELDPEGDYDKAVRVLRFAADSLNLGLTARHGKADGSVWFAAKTKTVRTRKD